jgi:RNA methyltransferase, TrmH family
MDQSRNSGTGRIDDLISRVRTLLQHRASRDASELFTIEGVRQFLRAYEAGFEFDTILHSRVLLQNEIAQKLVRQLVSQGIRRVSLTPEQFRAIQTAERASGIGAIVRQRFTPLARASGQRGLCWLVIEQLRSPGNLGTILRTAEATGVAGVIFVGHSCDPFDPRVVRASMGGIFHLHVVRTSPQLLREWLKRNGVRAIALDPRAHRLWIDLPIDAPLALFIGEERQGLSEPLRELCEIGVRLPMMGQADSLNVAVAAGVMMYELVRRSIQHSP